MNKPSEPSSTAVNPVHEGAKPTNEPIHSATGNKPRRIRVAELLGTVAVLCATVVVEAMAGPKLPKFAGD